MIIELRSILFSTYMRCIFALSILIFLFNPSFSQNANEFTNTVFLNKLFKDGYYLELKKNKLSYATASQAGNWGESVTGVIKNIKTKEKKIAFTFDACGGKNGNGFDKELIDFLKYEKIPATLFISGKWIDANFQLFEKLSKDPLIEIENHGLNHKPCSVDGKTIFGLKGTSNIEEAYDEIEANALKINAITHHNPRYYRPAAAYIDEACMQIAGSLGIKVTGFQILSGDAVASTPATVIEENVLRKIKPGAIIIMHFNHPEWNTFEAMQMIVPKLREKGYTFVRLDYSAF
jgi:peptidoglycan/xylan/chitin deacetylase (PgdA/CDA1 family)